MKKIFLFGIATTLLIVSIVSCKREYTCECTDDGGKMHTYSYKEKKKDAKRFCEEWNKFYSRNNNDIPPPENQGSCSLK